MNGAELVKKLAESGTGEGKLQIARKVLGDTYEYEGRIATTDEVILALESTFGVNHGTVGKAKLIVATGKWDVALQPENVPIESRLLANESVIPQPEPEKEPEKKQTQPPRR